MRAIKRSTNKSASTLGGHFAPIATLGMGADFFVFKLRVEMKIQKKDRQHVRVYLDVLNSPAWRALGPSAVKLYMDMRASLRSTNNGNIDATLSQLKHRGWRSDHTLAKSLRELEALGFIARTRNTVGVEHGSRVCNLYRFTDMDAYDFPKLGVSGAVATRDYLRFESATAAQKAVEEARKPSAKKKTTLQKVQRHAAENAVIVQINAAENAVGQKTTLQKVQRQKKAKSPETRMNTSFAADSEGKPMSDDRLQKMQTISKLPAHRRQHGSAAVIVAHPRFAPPWAIAGLAANSTRRMSAVARLADNTADLGRPVAAVCLR